MVGNQERLVEVTDAAQEECPTSILHSQPEMVIIAEQVLNIVRTNDAVPGSVPYGPDSNRWPARWYDMIRLASIEGYKVDEAKDKTRELMKG